MRSSVRASITATVLPLALVLVGCASEPEPQPVARGDLHLEAATEVVPGSVSRGETLVSVLRPHLEHDEDVYGVVEAVTHVFDLRRLRAAQPWNLERTLDGCLRVFDYEIDAERFQRVVQAGDTAHAFQASLEEYEVSRSEAVVTGGIGDGANSLFGAMTAAGEGPDLALTLADIFGGEIDFNTDIQPGDSFAALVEKVERDDRFVRYGPLAAARFENAGRTLTAVRFAPPGREAAYYDLEGRSLKRFFLKSPLKFEPQITSHFSRARMHPVLHVMRAHLGVDYRAPHGAPVIAVAAGVVTGAGWRGGGGNTVSIRHASGYESSYLHLSSIAPGVRPGARIAQGQFIGRVGATGLATGPHLDYRLKKNGTFVNPLTEHKRLPPGEPVPAESLDDFRALRDDVLERLGSRTGDVQLARQGDWQGAGAP